MEGRMKVIFAHFGDTQLKVTPVPMDYLTQFSIIDTNRDGLITRRELFKYALSIGEDISMVDTWFKLFDAQDKGVITIDDVSRTLGVPPPKYYKERLSRRSVSDGFDVFKSTPDLSRTTSVERADIYKSATRSLPKSKSQEISGTYHVTLHDLKGIDIEPVEDLLRTKLTHVIYSILDAGINEKMQDSLLAAEIGRALDRQYGRNWQVFVSKKTLGCAFGHLPGKMVQLKHKSYFVVTYQTGDNES
ncbi:hypothetical protein CLF_109548 [Clonorchis sinensis]|uniref:EF-hand domain-containing protein n=1 Tax=Clonorchis sinensis TaxID=79923 RepID=G7YSQ1_CLOSI|nr:hypothetical protein CLF_109548 [Clonorchis sinensis]